MKTKRHSKTKFKCFCRKTRRGYEEIRDAAHGAEEHAGGVDEGQDQGHVVHEADPAQVAVAAPQGARTETGLQRVLPKSDPAAKLPESQPHGVQENPQEARQGGTLTNLSMPFVFHFQNKF